MSAPDWIYWTFAVHRAGAWSEKVRRTFSEPKSIRLVFPNRGSDRFSRNARRRQTTAFLSRARSSPPARIDLRTALPPTLPDDNNGDRSGQVYFIGARARAISRPSAHRVTCSTSESGKINLSARSYAYQAHTAHTDTVDLATTLVATARKNWMASTCKSAEAQCAAPTFCHGASRAMRPWI
jgi:hypothetical protein